MSDAREQLVLGAYAAWNEGDLDRVLEGMSEDVEFDLSRRQVEAGVFKGPEGVRRFRDEIAEGYTNLEFVPRRLVPVGDLIVAQVTVRATGAASRIDVNTEVGHVWSFAGGRAARMEYHGSFEEALRSAEGHG